MNPSDYIRASDGNGEAVRAHITEAREIGDMSLITDSILNFPHKFVATSGTLNEDTGLIDKDTITVFKAHLDGSIIMIDAFAPGYIDRGHTVNQVIVLKPSTLWADLVADAIEGAADQSYVDSKSSVALVRNEPVNGVMDGVNNVFTILGTAVTGTVQLYRNGVRQVPGTGNDYSISGKNLVLAVPPKAGTSLMVDYDTSTEQFAQGLTGLVTNQTPIGAINGTNLQFMTASSYMPGSLEVWVNGLKQLPSVHYLETTPESGIFTFVWAPITGDNIIVNYSHTLGSIGNADTVDGYNVSSTPTPNNLFPLPAEGYFPASMLRNPYRFSASMASDQSVTGWQKMVANVKNFDPNNNYNTSTYQYTIPITGIYRFTVNALFLSQAGATCIVSLGKGDVTNDEFMRLTEIPNTTGNLTINGSVDVSCVAGERFHAMVYSAQTKTVHQNVNTIPGRYTRWSGHLVSAL